MGDLTIDELAKEAGLTVRNIRSHHTRGLLPPPEVRGRTGYYGDEHLKRLRLIQELQADGLPLRLVERLLTSRSAAADRLLALRRTVLAPLESSQAAADFTLEALQERFGEFTDDDLQRAFRVGSVTLRADGSLHLPQPELLNTLEEVMRHGVSLGVALSVAESVLKLSEDAARTFVDMVFEEIWLPFDEAGRPETEWADVAAAIDAVRPLAGEIFLQMLPRTITAEVERVFGEVLREQAESDDGATER